MTHTSMDSTIPGYHGRYLRVDVTDAAAEFRSLNADVLRRCLGGSGLGTHLLDVEGAAAAEPLSPAAPLVFAFSPLVGSPLTTSAKFAVVCKSPLTDRINDSLASSGFSIAGKKTGADAIVVVGRAREPSILVIDNGEVRVEPAGACWGLSIGQAESRLARRLAAGFSTALIGPAGENLVRYATISHDGRHAGRGGSGAVLGAKNIKAVCVRGDHRCEWAEPKQLISLAKSISEKSFGPATEKYRELGTATNLLVFNRMRSLPTRNFQDGSFEGAVHLAPETLSAVREKTRAYCAACTIGCEHMYSLRPKGDAVENPTGVRLEYENLFALGPLCGIDDADAVLMASKQCDELGIDTISAGGSIAFAMECVERGWLDAPWLRFGDGEALRRAIRLIAARDGLGDRMAGGSRRLAMEIGGAAIDIAPQVKGMEIPGYEPRAMQTMALGFAVGTRGADHNRSGAYEADFSNRVDRRNISTDSVQHAIETEDRAAIMDSMILCKFIRGVFDDFFAECAHILQLVTGWDITAKELRQTAQQIVTAKKRFNIAAGWTPAEDTLPSRFFRQSLSDDSRATIDPAEFRKAIRDYNLARGWTPEGWIDQDRLS